MCKWISLSYRNPDTKYRRCRIFLYINPECVICRGLTLITEFPAPASSTYTFSWCCITLCWILTSTVIYTVNTPQTRSTFLITSSSSVPVNTREVWWLPEKNIQCAAQTFNKTIHLYNKQGLSAQWHLHKANAFVETIPKRNEQEISLLTIVWFAVISKTIWT